MKKSDSWMPVVPVPDSAIAPKWPSTQKSRIIAEYRYENEQGQLCFIVGRFVDESGKKTFRPLSYGSVNEDEPRWRTKAVLPPYPAYGLLNATTKADAVILVTEGEKAAEAAAKLFPEYAVVTSCGGSQRAHMTDWSFCGGRTVVIWPDNDAAGQKYAKTVARLLAEEKPEKVAIVDVTHSSFPEKWDLADELPENISNPELQQMISTALEIPVSSEPEELAVGSPEAAVRYPYRLTSTQVIKETIDREGDVDSVVVCSRLEVLAKTRNDRGEEWGRLLGVPDPEGRLHKWAMPMTLLAGDGTEFRQKLLSLGLLPNLNAKFDLAAYVSSCEPRKYLTCVSRLGWYGDAFLLPAEVLGNDDIVYQGPYGGTDFDASGTLEDWQRNVADLAVGNSRLVFALALGFAAPLLELVGVEGGGFHFRGKSSLGKTTALSVGASVWGNGDPTRGFIRTWRATCNALEGIAASRCDSLLCLDEIGQANPKDVGDAAYMLANGQGKGRAQRNGSVREPEIWRLCFLSTGEVSLSDRMAELYSSVRTKAGQEVRVVDIPADTGSPFGILESIHGFAGARELVDHLKKTTAQYYGVAGREFVKKVIELSKANVRKRVAELQGELAIDFVGSDPQISRVYGKFSLVAAAAILASELGVLPIGRHEVVQSVKRCFEAWLSARGSADSYEKIALLKQVFLFFERFSASRFEYIFRNCEDIPRNISVPHDRAGYKVPTSDGTLEYLVTKEVFETEICRGFDPRWAEKIMLTEGYLRSNEPGRCTVKTKIPETAKQVRVYCFTSKILSSCQFDDEPWESRESGNREEEGNGHPRIAPDDDEVIVGIDREKSRRIEAVLTEDRF